MHIYEKKTPPLQIQLRVHYKYSSRSVESERKIAATMKRASERERESTENRNQFDKIVSFILWVFVVVDVPVVVAVVVVVVVVVKSDNGTNYMCEYTVIIKWSNSSNNNIKEKKFAHTIFSTLLYSCVARYSPISSSNSNNQNEFFLFTLKNFILCRLYWWLLMEHSHLWNVYTNPF